jgi:hypothetical protein
MVVIWPIYGADFANLCFGVRQWMALISPIYNGSFTNFVRLDLAN